ncbi:MAG: hypothetical protein Q7T51_03295 [Candidatus Moranbacteria bacterium]|nr:hypothetical protein [Candidatus Moranbacteria bacterium]
MFKKVAVISVVVLLAASHVSGMLWEVGQILASMLEGLSPYVISLVIAIAGLSWVIFLRTLEGVAGSAQMESNSEGVELQKGLCGLVETNQCIVGYNDLISQKDIIAEGDEYRENGSWYKITTGNRLIGMTYGGLIKMRRPIRDCGDCM